MGISINGRQNKYSLKKKLSDGPSENMRLLKNSNIAKVYILKWSQILISTARSSISGKP